MHNDSLTELRNAYSETRYTLKSSGIVIRPGINNPVFFNFCSFHSIKEWAFITASNPGSIEMDEESNLEANRKLLMDLKESGYLLFDGLGIPENPRTWKPEVSFFIADIGLNEAVSLAKKFNQNAIVYGSDCILPSVIWIGNALP